MKRAGIGSILHRSYRQRNGERQHDNQSRGRHFDKPDKALSLDTPRADPISVRAYHKRSKCHHESKHLQLTYPSGHRIPMMSPPYHHRDRREGECTSRDHGSGFEKCSSQHFRCAPCAMLRVSISITSPRSVEEVRRTRSITCKRFAIAVTLKRHDASQRTTTVRAATVIEDRNMWGIKAANGIETTNRVGQGEGGSNPKYLIPVDRGGALRFFGRRFWT